MEKVNQEVAGLESALVDMQACIDYLLNSERNHCAEEWGTEHHGEDADEPDGDRGLAAAMPNHIFSKAYNARTLMQVCQKVARTVRSVA